VTTRGAFRRQGLFVGSGGLYSPGPATASPLALRETTAGRRSHVVLSLGRSFTTSHLWGAAKADTPAIRSPTRSLTLSCQTPLRLGPRSLSPPLFLERFVRAYLGPGSCLPTSATNTTYGHQPELSFPRRDGGHDLLPFSDASRTTFSREAVTRGEPRIRPFVRAPVPVPPACAGLPDRDTEPNAPPPPACALGVQWRLTCTGLWTERRTCPRTWRALVGRLREECVRLAYADDVPLLGIQRAPAVAGAAVSTGTSPVEIRRTGQDPRSEDCPRRLPTFRGSGCLPPLRRRAAEDCSSCCPRRPPAHAAHTFPPWLGTKCFGWALQVSSPSLDLRKHTQI
jgi:hypothetical protein